MILNKLLLSKKGFTLIELIIFVVIGAIILPASFVAFTAAIKHFSTPDYYVKARFFAEQKMEELTSYSYIAIPSSSSDVPDTNYQRNWKVSFINSSLSPSGSDMGYKKIDISITMPDSSIYDVSTIVTKRPKS
jgi:prepilin-type N-terminal cleavage/methylation domain-containing protein